MDFYEGWAALIMQLQNVKVLSMFCAQIPTTLAVKASLGLRAANGQTSAGREYVVPEASKAWQHT